MHLVTNELGLVRDEADRTRNVGWEPRLPDIFRFGQDANVHCIFQEGWKII